MMTAAEAPSAKELWADYRLDLVRRLFAVAISIGIGSAIVGARWVKVGDMPNQAEWEQITIVILALFATVLSWDGYLISVHKKKLYDKLRFTIDVVLVFTYLFLFATSNHSHFWLPIICWMYTLYFFWDALSVIQFPQLYDTSYQPSSSTLSFVGKVFWNGLCNKPGVDRGPIITLSWTVYFFTLLAISWHYPNYNVYAALLFGGCGLALYRHDKAYFVGPVRGFKMLSRVAVIAFLSLAALLLGYYFSNRLAG
jgi:hypothetical protein